MRPVWLAFSLVTLACTRTESAPDLSIGATPTVFDIDFEEATPADLFGALEQASGQRVTVDGDSLPLALCTTATLHGARLDVATFAARVTQSIRPGGLILEPSGSGWVARRAPDAPVDPCRRLVPDASAPDAKALAR